MTEEKAIDRIMAMLRKAEATQFEEEAAAFFAKAHKLIAQHGLEGRGLGEIDPFAPGVSEAPETEHGAIVIDKLYAKAKLRVVGAVAKANGVAWYYSEGRGRGKVITLCGKPGANAAVKATVAAALTFGDARALKLKATDDDVTSGDFFRAATWEESVDQPEGYEPAMRWDGKGWTSLGTMPMSKRGITKRHRIGFWQGFAESLAQKLDEANAEVDEHNGGALLPALRDDLAASKAILPENLRSVRAGLGGSQSGRSAGERAGASFGTKGVSSATRTLSA